MKHFETNLLCICTKIQVGNVVKILVMYPRRNEIHDLMNIHELFMNIHELFMNGNHIWFMN